jgi:cytoskeletal protein RodZ
VFEESGGPWWPYFAGSGRDAVSAKRCKPIQDMVATRERWRAPDAHSRRTTVNTESIGSILKRQRESRHMSIAEVSRATRIPVAALGSIESDHFDDLPGEVFVRGFLKAYSQCVGLLPQEILARYTASRRVAFVTPIPMASPVQAAREGQGRRFGVAIAFVLLLILFTLAISIVLKPRGHDMPAELSMHTASQNMHSASIANYPYFLD